jgi:hypothetical protein
VDGGLVAEAFMSCRWSAVLALSLCGIVISVKAHAGGRISKVKEPEITAEDRAHWAFRKPVRGRTPEVFGRDLVNNPIDGYVLARLEKAGLTLGLVADRVILLRRVTMDLTGLPPTPGEVDRFVRDRRPDAFARVVDRLLASPRYGEHWAQHWLDVVRYAESNGYELDAERPHAWRYRDYVIRAFNADMPYDRFVREQVAGDELARGQGSRQTAGLLIAAGFNRCGPVHLVSGNTDPDVNRQEVLTEMTGAIGSAFLGLTMGCARCHNHKFDPISQADYYRLQAFFAPAQPAEVDIAPSKEREDYNRISKKLEAQLAPLRQEIHGLEAPYFRRLAEAKKARLEPGYREALAIEAKKRTPQQKKLAEHAEILIKVSWDELLEALTPADKSRRAALRAKVRVLGQQLPMPPAQAWTVRDEAKTPPTFILRRGDPKSRGPEVHPAYPRVLQAADGACRIAEASLPRLALANWLTNTEQPLTARVMVNRIWQRHFGRGLVATPHDFGIHGEAPTHPELLDWLACEFMAHGWSVKHVHRLLLLSRTYQQAGRRHDPAASRRDPGNRLLWHMPRRRLGGEGLRDSVLAVTGSLYARMGGPMVRVPLEPEVYDLIFTEGEPEGLWPVTPDPREHGRRSIYLFAKRNVRLPLLEAFDQPDRVTSCPVRPVSTFAPQALVLLNGPFIQEQSKCFAQRLLAECGPDAGRQIERAYRLALCRPPQAAERTMVLRFLRDQAAFLRARVRAGRSGAGISKLPAGKGPAAAAALADFCLALLNCNEFIYVR